MHDAGYCPMDIKASNVFLAFDDRAVVGDFGGTVPTGATPREITSSHWPQVGPWTTWQGCWLHLTIGRAWPCQRAGGVIWLHLLGWTRLRG